MGIGSADDDRKGLTGGVRLDHQFLFGWEISILPLDDLSSLSALSADAGPFAAGPLFHRATVELPAPADAFIAVPDPARSLVWLNGFLLGRLDDRGPATTLYAPGPLWLPGSNDVTVLALDGTNPNEGLRVRVRDQPDLGPLGPPVSS